MHTQFRLAMWDNIDKTYPRLSFDRRFNKSKQVILEMLDCLETYMAGGEL